MGSNAWAEVRKPSSVRGIPNKVSTYKGLPDYPRSFGGPCPLILQVGVEEGQDLPHAGESPCHRVVTFPTLQRRKPRLKEAEG